MNKILNIFGILAILIVSASLISATNLELGYKTTFDGADHPSLYYSVDGSLIGNSYWKIKNFDTDSGYVESGYYQPVDSDTGIIPYAGYDLDSFSTGAVVSQKFNDDFSAIAGAETYWDDSTFNWSQNMGAVAGVTYKINDDLSAKATYFVPNAQEFSNWDDGGLSIGIKYNLNK